MKKKCSRCGKEKDLGEFYKDRSHKDGHASRCKACDRLYQLQRDKNKRKEYMREYHISYYSKNREKILARGKVYRAAHLGEEKARNRKYRESHVEEEQARHRRYYIANKERISSRNKEYARKALSQIRIKKAQYKRERLRKDAVYREQAYLRSDIARIFARKGKVFSPRIEQIIGCSCQSLYAHLLSTWMDRYGEEWAGEPHEIDHIVPLCTARSIEEVHVLFHFSNLRLLTPSDNRLKGAAIFSPLPADRI